MQFIFLILYSCCAFGVEPNRHYQTVSNHLIDELDAIVTAGELTPAKAGLAVQRTLEGLMQVGRQRDGAYCAEIRRSQFPRLAAPP